MIKARFLRCTTESGAEVTSPDDSCCSIRFHDPPNVSRVKTVPTVRVNVMMPQRMPYFWAAGRLVRPKAWRRPVGDNAGRMERAEVSLSRSDMVVDGGVPLCATACCYCVFFC